MNNIVLYARIVISGQEGSYCRLDHRVFLYNVHRSLATDPYFLFCSWLSHTSERGWEGGRGRWGRYILRVSYNLTNIQTFRGVCNSEECISEVVALNSIRRCLMIFWFFFFVFFFSDDRADDDSRREINRSNGISANRGRGRTNVYIYIYIYTRNELVDQRAAWLNRFYLTNLPRCPRLTHFVFLFFFFTVRLIGTVNCLQLIFTRREIVLRCTTAGKFIHEIVIKGVTL